MLFIYRMHAGESWGKWGINKNKANIYSVIHREQNVNLFSHTKTFKPNFTPMKAYQNNFGAVIEQNLQQRGILVSFCNYCNSVGEICLELEK